MKQILYLLFFCGVATDIFAQCYTYTPTITVSSSSISESPPSLISNEIGLDYPSTSKNLIVPKLGIFTIDINNSNTCPGWVVSVARDNNSNTDLKFYVIRTSDGNPSTGSSIEAASLANYVEITTNPQTFMRGVNNRTKIQIKFKITGISVILDAKAYLSNITFSVIGTP
jgi:hypothetical protein